MTTSASLPPSGTPPTRSTNDGGGILQALLDHRTDGMAVIVAGRYTYVNPALCRMLQCTEADLLRSTPGSHIAEHDCERARGRLQSLLRGKAPVPSEFDCVRGDGTTFPAEISSSQRISYEGSPAFLMTVRDQTERHEARRARLDAESKYRQLVENSLVGVYLIQDERFVYVNPTAAAIHGYTVDEMLALPSIHTLTLEEDRTTVSDRLARRLEGKVGSTRYTVRVRRKDGEVIELEVHGGLSACNGRPAIMGTCLDVTDRQRADATLRASEERFRQLFEQAPIGIALCSPDGRFVQVNTAFCDMLGYSSSELTGRSIADVTHPDDVGGSTASIDEVFQDSKLAVRLHKRYLRKDGTVVYAETTVSLTRNDAGETQYALGMIQDVTERRALEEQLQQSIRLESVGQLAAGVAHNFNNALMAISGYSDLIAERLGAQDPSRVDLERITEVTEQSAGLTTQLLAFSRQEHVEPSVFCLNGVVQKTSDLVSPLLGGSLTIRLDLDRDLPNIRSDRAQIEQIVMNLVLNARDAMPDGGVVTIEAKAVHLDADLLRAHRDVAPGRYVRLVVTDTGCGMDEDTAARVFEPFFTTKEPGKGVGLGLSMVHGAVKTNGGFVTLTSEPSAGASFSVYLPAVG